MMVSLKPFRIRWRYISIRKDLNTMVTRGTSKQGAY